LVNIANKDVLKKKWCSSVSKGTVSVKRKKLSIVE
jgi:hypothetical protein